MASLLLPAFNSAFLRGLHTTRCATRLTSKSYSHPECVPSSKVTYNVPRSPCRKSRIAEARVAMTDCITNLPSAFSTATEIVSRWTSRPTYLMLFIGCSFREVSLLLQHSNHNLLRKGRPFIMRAPSGLPLAGWAFGLSLTTRHQPLR